VAALRHALAVLRAFGQPVALDEGHELEMLGEHARGHQAGDAAAEGNGVVIAGVVHSTKLLNFHRELRKKHRTPEEHRSVDGEDGRKPRLGGANGTTKKTP